ncbi:MAG: HNH endonuclease [Spirochaetales bacterium]|nr:HNH endonuclease [Spirochaetales bacterium]
MLKLQEKYKDASPQVKLRYSKIIERGSIAETYKKDKVYKCEICNAMGICQPPFIKKNDTPYAETHHIIPVSELKKGSLSKLNLLCVCPNHHRQLHYGKVKLVELSNKKVVFEIDDQIIVSVKTTTPRKINRVEYSREVADANLHGNSLTEPL